jgi:hypothetical protein
MNEKLKIAQSTVSSMDYHLQGLEKSIKSQKASVDHYLEKGDFYWLEAAAKKLADYCQEYQELKKKQDAMQEMLDFLIFKDEPEEC